MKVAFASDHRGFKLKSKLAEFVGSKNHSVVDFGTYSQEPCDYPDYVYPASKAVVEKEADRAIVICYSGIGSSIVANKIRGVRAALVSDTKSAQLTRLHNNSNVLVLSSRLLSVERAKRIVALWLATDFEGGRHQRRLNKIGKIEEKENV